MGRKVGESADRVLFEELEPRVLLDGNVKVTGSWWSGDMTIKGDAANNDILITPGPGAREFYVQGRNNTTVNGQPWVLVKGVWDDIKIKMKGGADVVELNNGCAVSDRVEFKGGGGSDTLFVNNSTIWGKLKYSGNWGHDALFTWHSWFDRKAYIEGGPGQEEFYFDTSTFNRGVRASASRGHGEHIHFENCTFNGWVSAYLGAGDDFFCLINCAVNAGGRANGGWGWDDANWTGSYPTFYLKNFEA